VSFAAVVFAATRVPEPQALPARQTAGIGALAIAAPIATLDMTDESVVDATAADATAAPMPAPGLVAPSRRCSPR